MLRRWPILLSSLVLIGGSALGATAGAASASPRTPSPRTPSPSTASPSTASRAPAVNPGGLIRVSGSRDAIGARAGARNLTVSSSNWSGYADTTGTFTSVSASWTQPAGKCGHGSTFSSFWVGIDGYNSSTVEQTGSEVDCSGGRPVYFAWYEMFPAFPVNYSDTVRAGDHFNATVTYLGGQNFSLQIADTTQGWSHNTDASLGSTPALSSAEVIAEAPCCTASGGILPLTNFGTMSFTGSVANGQAIGTSGLGPVQIIMVNNAGRQKDSVSGLTNGENFSVTWLRST